MTSTEADPVSTNEELQRFFELSLDMMCIAGFEGRFKRVNPAFEAALGYSKEELCSRPYLDFIHPDDIEATKQEVEKQLQRKQPVLSFENRYRCKDGSYKWLSWKSKPVDQLMYAVARDVTEIKKTQETLKNSEAQFHGLFEHSPDAKICVDARGAIVRVNRQAEVVFGYEREELLGKPLEVLMPEKYRKTHVAHREGFAASPRNRAMGGAGSTLLGRKKDGQEFPVDISLGSLKTENGALALATVRDITERKRAEEKIGHLNEELEMKIADLGVVNKELEAFSYSVSHDLRAPLRSMVGFSTILLEDHSAALGQEAKDCVARIMGAAQRMGQLIDGLLDLSRITRTEISQGVVNLSALAENAVADLQANEPDRRANAMISKNLVARGDVRLLRVVLTNLIGNAWKFTAKVPEARIEFGETRRDGKPAFYVRDNGAGFDMRHSDKLFGTFQRLHAADEFQGTGIGLATVRRIIHRHGGEIWAEAEPGKGATFYFTV